MEVQGESLVAKARPRQKPKRYVSKESTKRTVSPTRLQPQNASSSVLMDVASQLKLENCRHVDENDENMLPTKEILPENHVDDHSQDTTVIKDDPSQDTTVIKDLALHEIVNEVRETEIDPLLHLNSLDVADILYDLSSPLENDAFLLQDSSDLESAMFIDGTIGLYNNTMLIEEEDFNVSTCPSLTTQSSGSSHLNAGNSKQEKFESITDNECQLELINVEKDLQQPCETSVNCGIDVSGDLFLILDSIDISVPTRGEAILSTDSIDVSLPTRGEGICSTDSIDIGVLTQEEGTSSTYVKIEEPDSLGQNSENETATCVNARIAEARSFLDNIKQNSEIRLKVLEEVNHVSLMFSFAISISLIILLLQISVMLVYPANFYFCSSTNNLRL